MKMQKKKLGVVRSGGGVRSGGEGPVVVVGVGVNEELKLL